MLAETSTSYESSKDGFYSSNVVIQFSKEKQYGLEGTGCRLYVNPTTDIEFEVSRKDINGFDHYSYSAPTSKETEVQHHIVYQLWLYCIGIILIAIGICIIIIGIITNKADGNKIYIIKNGYTNDSNSNASRSSLSDIPNFEESRNATPQRYNSTNHTTIQISDKTTGGHWKQILHGLISTPSNNESTLTFQNINSTQPNPPFSTTTYFSGYMEGFGEEG